MKKIVIVSFLFLSSCATFTKNVEFNQLDNKNYTSNFIKQTKIVINLDEMYIDGEDNSYFEDINTLVKNYNKNIKSPKYTLKLTPKFYPKHNIGYHISTFLHDDKFKSEEIMKRYVKRGGTELGYTGQKTLALLELFPYISIVPIYQLVGLPWISDSRVSFEATLTYDKKEIGEYTTDGIEKKQLVSCWYAYGPWDAEKKTFSESFEKGIYEIFSQIENDKNPKEKKKAIDKRNEEFAEKVREAEVKYYNRQLEEKNNFIEHYGKPKCGGSSMLQNMIYSHGELNKNCIQYMENGEFDVLQQISDGTLITTTRGYILLVEENSKDSELVDGVPLKAGYFDTVGTYKYQNVLGSTKTIYRIRRMP